MNKPIFTPAMYWQWIWPVSDREGLAVHLHVNYLKRSSQLHYDHSFFLFFFLLKQTQKLNKLTAPSLLRTWGFWIALHRAVDVSLACTKLSSSKSPQSSHSSSRLASTFTPCEDGVFLPCAHPFGSASGLLKQVVLLVLIWVWSQ